MAIFSGVLHSGVSDISPFSDENRSIKQAATSDTLLIALVASEIQYWGFITESGVPNNILWEQGNTWTIEYESILGNHKILGTCRCVRIDENGVILESGSWSAESILNDNQIFTPSNPNWNRTDEDVDNRLAVEFQFTNTDTKPQSCSFGVNTLANEIITNISSGSAEWTKIEASGDLFLCGHNDYAASGDLYLYGLDILTISGHLFIHGYNNAIASGNLFAQGHKITFTSGDLYTEGYEYVANSGNLFISGPQQWVVSSGDLFIYGYDHIAISDDLFIQGHQTIIASGDLHTEGYEHIISSGDLFTQGYNIFQTSGNLCIQGHEDFIASGDLFIHGHNDIIVSGNLFIYGQDSIEASGDLFILVPEQITASSTLFLQAGGNSLSVSGNLFISGPRSITTSGDLFIQGYDILQISGNLYIQSHEGIITSGILFIEGYEEVITSGNIFIYGCIDHIASGNLFVNGCEDITASVDLFIQGHEDIVASGDLFIKVPEFIIVSVNLFIQGYTDDVRFDNPFDISGLVAFFINGYEQKPALACPIFDSTASIQIKDSLIQIYQSRIDALINQLGKNVYLEFNPIQEQCPNCEYDTIRNRSTGVYKIGGPRPFQRGRQCPYCKGKGFIETAVYKCVKCLVQWNPKDAKNFGIAVTQTQGIVRLKTYLTEMDDLLRARTAIVDYDIADQIRSQVRLIREPIPVGLREDRYCISFWELI